VWQPPLGFFDYELPFLRGFWAIEFNPESINDFARHAVQSLKGELQQVGATAITQPGQFEFTAEQMYYYMYTVIIDVSTTVIISSTSKMCDVNWKVFQRLRLRSSKRTMKSTENQLLWPLRSKINCKGRAHFVICPY
jgi:cell division protein FtsL